MKIAILGESSADEAAMAIFVQAALGQPFERTQTLQAHGWTQVVGVLPQVIRKLHYGTDTDGLVILLDSNGAPLHAKSHDDPAKSEPGCRYCIVQRIIRTEFSKFRTNSRPQPHLPILRIAIGIAVPALEAWLLSTSHSGMTEAHWIAAKSNGRDAFTRPHLKRLLYGTHEPSLQLETAKMIERATEIAKNFPQLKTAFPAGFGTFHDEIRSWK